MTRPLLALLLAGCAATVEPAPREAITCLDFPGTHPIGTSTMADERACSPTDPYDPAAAWHCVREADGALFVCVAADPDRRWFSFAPNGAGAAGSYMGRPTARFVVVVTAHDCDEPSDLLPPEWCP